MSRVSVRWTAAVVLHLVLALVSVSLVGAQTRDTSPTAGEAAAVARLRADTRSIEALIRGDLEPKVDARALFLVDAALEEPGASLGTLFVAPAVPAAVAVSPDVVAPDVVSPDVMSPDVVSPDVAVSDVAPPTEAAAPGVSPPTDPEPAVDTLEAARAALAAAQRRFLSLPASEQARLLHIHDERRAALRERERAGAVAAERAVALRSAAAQLAGLVDGTLDVAVDPAPLVRLDLTDLVLQWALRDATLPGQAGPLPLTGLAVSSQRELAAAAREHAAAWLEFAERPANDRAALLTTHRQRQDAARAETEERKRAAEAKAAERERAAEEAKVLARQQAEAADEEAATAARDREAALAAAAASHDARRKAAASERARLLGVKEEQARFEGELLRRRSELVERVRRAQRWPERVRELGRRIDLGDAMASEADQLWGEVSEELAAAREEFGTVVRALESGERELPVAGAGAPLTDMHESDREPLLALRDGIRANEPRLTTLEQEMLWEAGDALAVAVREMDGARLALIPWLGPDRRQAVTGFGPAGIEQVRGALTQGLFAARYRLISVPRILQGWLTRLKDAPLSALMGLVQFFFVIFAFRWWRRRGDDILKGLLGGADVGRRARPRAADVALWYLLRARGPLEWLVFLAVLLYGLELVALVPELSFIWLVVVWVLIPRLVVELIDSAASRGSADTQAARQRQRLRTRSLRLLGGTTVVFGLTLSLTARLVGQGALYMWVATLCFLLLLPVAVLLVAWWRTIVHATFERRSATRGGPGWVRSHTSGVRGFVAAGVGGLWLLGEGLARWAGERASELHVTRRAHAYLFRREMARQARLRESGEGLEPLSDAALETLAPERPALLLVTDAAQTELTAVVGELERNPGAMISVVAERGGGKSTFLARLRDAYDESETLAVDCPLGGYPALLRELCRALGVGDGEESPEALAEAVRSNAPRAIVIDDTSRLVRPLIGGLSDFDKLRALVRATGETTAWVMAFSTPTWNQLRRARSGRRVFDLAVTLPAWEEEQIVTLLRGRAAEADLAPRFDDIVLSGAWDPEVQGEDHTERRYYRMLWDYADGNPAVALHFWQESLGLADDGEAAVRVFEEPDPLVVDGLPAALHFVLRALVQLEPALPADVGAAARLSKEATQDALRFLLAHGLVAWRGERVVLTWRWYRAVTRTLVRQHLLIL